MSTISPDEIVDLIANIRTRHPEAELHSPGGRLAGARGDAEDVVRQTAEACRHCCLN